jgi:hypothetical protein
MLPEVLFAGESLSTEKPAIRNQRKICSSTPIRIAQPQSKMASLGWVATTVLALPADRAYHQIPEQQCADLAFLPTQVLSDLTIKCLNSEPQTFRYISETSP